MGNKQSELDIAPQNRVRALFPAKKQVFTLTQSQNNTISIKYRECDLKLENKKILYIKHVTATKVLIYTKHIGYINSHRERSGYWLTIYNFFEHGVRSNCFAQFIVDFYLDEQENKVYVLNDEVRTSCWSINDEKFITFNPFIVSNGLVFEKTMYDWIFFKNWHCFYVCMYADKTLIYRCGKIWQVSEARFLESKLSGRRDEFHIGNITWHIPHVTDQEKNTAISYLCNADTSLSTDLLQIILNYCIDIGGLGIDCLFYETDSSYKQFLLQNIDNL